MNLCVAGVIFLSSVVMAMAQATDSLQALIDNRVVTMKKAVGIVAGTVDAQGTHVYATGRMDAGETRAPDGDTLFEIGSISKVFTSLLLADMIERGEVKGDDPVERYLPKGAKVPSRNGKQITLLRLSMQNSGLPRMPDNFRPADAANPFADYDGAKLLAFLAKYRLTRDPGSKYEYSNLGVGLLGFALAHRTGMSYEELVRKRIFEPLGMRDSAITLNDAQKSKLAHGYDMELKPVKNWDLDALAGAGAIRSTANDMLRFLAANLGLRDSPLKAAMLRMRSVEKRETGVPHTQIAMGWHVNDEYGPEIFWHNGGTAGYRSFIGMDVKAQRGVVVLCNSYFDVDNLGFHELNAKYPAPMLREEPEVELDAETLAQYAGKYQLAPQFAIAVTARGKELYMQATGSRKCGHTPRSGMSSF